MRRTAPEVLFKRIFKSCDRDFIDFTYNALSVIIRRINECREDPRRDDRLDVDSRDEYEHWIFAGNVRTAFKAIQPKPGRAGTNVCH